MKLLCRMDFAKSLQRERLGKPLYRRGFAKLLPRGWVFVKYLKGLHKVPIQKGLFKVFMQRVHLNLVHVINFTFMTQIFSQEDQYQSQSLRERTLLEAI